MFLLYPFVESESFDGQLLIPHEYDLVWGIISFVIIALLFGKFVVPTFTRILDERSEKIEGSLQAAEVAKAEVAKEREKMEQELRESRLQSAEIRKEAHEAAALTAKKVQANAQEEAKRVHSQALRQIDADRDAAYRSLQSYVGELAVDLAGKILGESVADKELQSRVIDRFLDELEAKNAGSSASVTKEN